MAARISTTAMPATRTAPTTANTFNMGTGSASRWGSLRKHREIGPRLFNDPGVRRALQQAAEIGSRVPVRVSERKDLVDVEKRWRRCAIGQGELIAHGPA